MTPELQARATALLGADAVAGGVRWRQRLGSGFTNDNHVVELRGRVLVYRAASPLAAALGIDRARERTLLQRAVAAGLAPDVVAFDVASGDMASVHEAGAIEQPLAPAVLAALLRRVHALDAGGIAATALLPTLWQWHREALAGGVALSPAAAAALARCAREPLHEVAVVHHDVNPWNCLVSASGTLRLLDWEYAGRGDPAFDLAAAVAQFGLGDAGEQALLAAYGAATALRHRIPSAQLHFQLREHLWAAFMILHGRSRPQIAQQLARTAGWLEARSL